MAPVIEKERGFPRVIERMKRFDRVVSIQIFHNQAQKKFVWA